MSLFWHPAETARGRGDRRGRSGAAFAVAPSHDPVAATTLRPMREWLLGVFVRRPFLAFAFMTLAASALFYAFPGIDRAASRWFMSSDGFALAQIRALVELRDLNRVLPIVLLVPVAAIVVAHLSGYSPRWMMRPYKAIFILTFYAVGPGIVVNGLKLTMGRPRPQDTLDFGGMLPFSPAWQYSTACLRNCSFTSGEAGSAVAMLAFVLVLPKAWRAAALIVLVPVALAFSINRIAFGAHFLSDVVLSWLLCAMIMFALWPRFYEARERIDDAVTHSAAPALIAFWREVGRRLRLVR